MILAGLIWLLLTRTVSVRIPLSMLAGACLTSWALGRNALSEIMSGGMLFAASFMATDYVTGPRPGPGRTRGARSRHLPSARRTGSHWSFLATLARGCGAHPLVYYLSRL
jgi:hypothetical protein